MRALSFLPWLLVGGSGCAVAPLEGEGEGCTASGVTTDDGVPVMHYAQQLDVAGRVVHQDRWVHGAESAATSDYLYADGLLVHRRDDVDGDGRVEFVVDWVRDADGRLLELIELDRVSGRSARMVQEWLEGQVVRRVQEVDGTLIGEEQLVLDADGRPIAQVQLDLAGAVQSSWSATYLEPAPGLTRHRTGHLSGTLVTDATEGFDEQGRLTWQEGLVDGYQRVYTMAWADERPVLETLAYGELEHITTWSYDEQSRLLEESEVLWAGGVRVDEIATRWAYDCPE